MLVVFGSGIQVASLEQSFFVTVDLGPFAALFSLLFIITLINAFNVIDGIDGLAGGLSLISLTTLAFLANGCDVCGLAVLAACAVSGFLIFNLPLGVNRQLRSFMGDAGSTFLGLTVATIGISVSQNPMCAVPPVVGLWLVAVPVFDLFSAAIRRVMQKRSPFAPDHEHLHHVLIEEGLSARSALMVMLSSAGAFAGLGLAGHFAGVQQGIMLIGWLGGLTLYYQAMRRPALVVSAVKCLIALPHYRVRRS
jgi:UDP-GlcNAc:undecaprenyl-phosphate GlcNAc-1-phosphate transferase